MRIAAVNSFTRLIYMFIKYSVTLYVTCILGQVNSFGNILACTSEQHVYPMTEAFPADIGSVVIVGALTCYALLHSMCDLKAAQMSMHHTLIWWLLLYEFMEKTKKKLLCAKDESIVDYCTVTRWFKKFLLSCKNFVKQTRSGRPEIMDLKTPCHKGKSGKYQVSLASQNSVSFVTSMSTRKLSKAAFT